MICVTYLSLSFPSLQVSAVGEWLESDRTFHIIRDHPSHNGEFKIIAMGRPYRVVQLDFTPEIEVLYV